MGTFNFLSREDIKMLNFQEACVYKKLELKIIFFELLANMECCY